MLNVSDALALVCQHAGRQPTTQVELEHACGLVLAEAVTSDVDSPPFTKALMDGFAVRDEDMKEGSASLEKIGEVAAGAVTDLEVTPGTTLQIMTGAPMPQGADAVVMVEKSRTEGSRVLLDDDSFRPGQNVMPLGREIRLGEEVLRPGTLLGPAEIGLLATVGKAQPKVYRRPRVAILSTGDELVPPGQKPGAGQIRNSNESTIAALAQRAGAEVVCLGIARDNVEDLSEKVAQGLSSDLLLLSGGVSAGKRDLVPSVLAGHGVETIFHKVEFKPGKPVWFGTHEGGLVFGLPGNPVSVLVCFEVFVRTALRVRQNRPDARPPHIEARLEVPYEQSVKRLTYHPAQLTLGPNGYQVQPVTWFGSPDLRALVAANALMVLPVSDTPIPQGTPIAVLPLPRDL